MSRHNTLSYLPKKLALDTKRTFQFVLTKIKNKAAQDALVGLASSIKASSTTYFALARCFMHMTMNAYQGL